MRTIMMGRVREISSQAVEQKINNQKNEIEKLQTLLELKKKIEDVSNNLASLTTEHDSLAKEIGALRSVRSKRSTNSEVQECRDDIVSMCKQPKSMRDLLDSLSGKYNESTIKNQTRSLLDDLELSKIGDRGQNVMYLSDLMFKGQNNQ